MWEKFRSLTPEQQVRLSARVMLIWTFFSAVVIFLLASEKFSQVFSLWFFFSIVLFSVISHIIGKKLNLPYFQIIWDPQYTFDVWKQRSFGQKMVLLIFLGFTLWLLYTTIFLNYVPSILVPILLLLITYRLVGRQMRGRYRRLYGKDVGDRLFTVMLEPLHALDRFHNWRFLFFLFVINPIEIILVVKLLFSIFANTDETWIYWFVVFIIAIIIQDGIVLHLLSKQKGEKTANAKPT